MATSRENDDFGKTVNLTYVQEVNIIPSIGDAYTHVASAQIVLQGRLIGRKCVIERLFHEKTLETFSYDDSRWVRRNEVYYLPLQLLE